MSLAESSGGLDELREVTLSDSLDDSRVGGERLMQEGTEDSQLLLMQFSINQLSLEIQSRGKYEPRHKKTSLPSFPPGPTQTRLCSYRNLIESWNLFKKEEVGLNYPCGKNKGADQLRSYCEADLPLCFCIGKDPVIS